MHLCNSACEPVYIEVYSYQQASMLGSIENADLLPYLYLKVQLLVDRPRADTICPACLRPGQQPVELAYS